MTGPRRAVAAPHRAGQPTLPAWGTLCFFASGAAGLLYEVVWSKELTYLLGNSLHAVATVVAAFLGGLALGARWLGTPLARRGRGPRTYALLELGVLALGLASVPVLRGLDPLVGALYRSFGGESAGFALARFALLSALLLPPAALMGATLPVLVGHFERGRVGPALARLYAINTFGAVAGSMAGGFALLPGIGLAATTWVAAALNAAVALVAWRAPAAGGPEPEAGADTEPGAARPSPARVVARAPKGSPAAHGPARAPGEAGALVGGRRTAFALLFASSGFAALAFQIAWVRLFGLMFGSSVYSFSAVLGIYLTGLGLGSVLVAPLMRRGMSLAAFGRLQITLSVAAALMLHAFSRLPEWMLALGERAGPRWGVLFAGEVGLCAVLLLVPCALLGAAFPAAARLLQVRDGGHAAGFAYAVNTLGTIAGSLGAGFFMVPNWGVQGTQLVALALSGGVGLCSLALALERDRRRLDVALIVGGAALAAAIAVLAPRWDPTLMSSGIFRPSQAMQVSLRARLARGAEPAVRRATRQDRVLYYREGVNASVLVGTSADGKERWLRVGGKTDASTDDMETQVLVGLLPAVCADSGAKALVIGLGSGFTAAGVLAGGVGPTEVVELEPGVVEGSRFFHAPGENPLDDPRVRLILGDARTHLAHGAGRYGVIVSQPSNPWIAGVNNLFTVDFYRRVRARLDERGVFCQWMQLYELTPETFASLVASFFEVFPEGQVFSLWSAMDVLLVAMPEGRGISLERLRAPASRRLLERAKISSPDELPAFWAGPFDSLEDVARGAVLNRDDRPVVEYRAPRDLVSVGRTMLTSHPRMMALVPFARVRPAGALFSAWTPETWYEARVRGLLAFSNDELARKAVEGARAAGLGPLAARLEVEVAAADRRHRAGKEIESARLSLAVNRIEEARGLLERAIEIEPGAWMAWALIADLERQAGRLAGADSALDRVRAAGTPEALGEAALVGGTVELGRQRPAVALERFREAQRLTPKNSRPYVLEAGVLQGIGNLEGARAALMLGLAANPDDREITEALARLDGARRGSWATGTPRAR